jgi:hypothetical protein
VCTFVFSADISTGAPNIRLQLGMITLYPAIGSVPVGGTVQISVDMTAEIPGFCEEVTLFTLYTIITKRHVKK